VLIRRTSKKNKRIEKRKRSKRQKQRIAYVAVKCIYLYLSILMTSKNSLSLSLVLSPPKTHYSPLFLTGCTSGYICAMYIIAHIIHMHVTAVTLSKCFK